MTPLFGHTRTCLKARHALDHADGHVASALPGLDKVRLVTHITPAMGAGFAQLSLTFEEAGGVARFPAGLNEAVLYVAAGVVRCQVGGATGATQGRWIRLHCSRRRYARNFLRRYVGSRDHLSEKICFPAPGSNHPLPFSA